MLPKPRYTYHTIKAACIFMQVDGCGPVETSDDFIVHYCRCGKEFAIFGYYVIEDSVKTKVTDRDVLRYVRHQIKDAIRCHIDTVFDAVKEGFAKPEKPEHWWSHGT